MVEVNHHTLPFQGIIILSFLAFIFNIISFFSWNWIESYPQYQSTFTKMGLWVACLNKYQHPEDYVSKLYEGCWFIYWKEYKFIHDWLTPPWFIAVQVLASVSLICNAVAFVMLLLKALDIVQEKRRKTDGIMIILQIIATLCYIYDLTFVGVMSKDRNWLPRHDHNRVGWGFALHVIGAFCTVYVVILMLFRFAMLHCQQGIPWDLPIVTNSDKSKDPGTYSSKEADTLLQQQSGDTMKAATLVSAADASQRHREFLQKQQHQQRSRLASAASSTYGGGAGPRPAASYGRLPGVPQSMASKSGSQPYLGPHMTDSTV